MKQRIQHMLWLNILPDLITFSFVYNTAGTGGCQSTGFLTVNFKIHLIYVHGVQHLSRKKQNKNKTNKVQLIISFFNLKLNANRHDIFGPRMLAVVGQCWHQFAKDSQLILWRQGVMYVLGPNNVGRAVQTMWCHALEIIELKKCLQQLAQKFDQFQTLCNNSQLHAMTL